MSEIARERLYPWIGSIVITAGCWFFAGRATYVTAVTRLVDPIITVSTLAFGFLLTVTTMLISMEKRTVIQELRGIGAYNGLLGYLRSSIYAWLLVAAFSVVTVLVETDMIVPFVRVPWYRAGFALWVFLVTLGFLTTIRVARIMFALLRFGSGSTRVAQSERREEARPRVTAPRSGSRG